MFDKPGAVPLSRTLKLLIGLNQKGMWSGAGVLAVSCHGCCTTGREAPPSPWGHEAKRSKVRSPPFPIHHWGGRRVRKKRSRGGGSGMREEAKALP